MSLKKQKSSASERLVTPEEQQAKVAEIRKFLGPAAEKLPTLCSDASILRYLRARNWNTKKSSKMLKDTIKWRLAYKPEKIRWEDIAREAETGKIYRASYCDKLGRPVLVMRPGFQNTNSTKGQIMYLVYCMENAIMNLSPDGEQMVWLIDFQGWSMSSISLNATRETAHVLQDHYPERLGLAILYCPPKIFESFWKMVKPFLDSKTFKKVRFVYSDDPESMKVMEDLFDMDKLESAFGGRNPNSFNYELYAKMMKEDDSKIANLAILGSSSLGLPSSLESESQLSETAASDNVSEDSPESGNVSDEGSPDVGDENHTSPDKTLAGVESTAARHETAKEEPEPVSKPEGHGQSI